MSALVRTGSWKTPRLHAIAAGRPVCGGGYRGRDEVWQHDIGQPNCERCAAIVERRQAAGRRLLLTIAYLITQSKFQL
jgi:hypothetical protein